MIDDLEVKDEPAADTQDEDVEEEGLQEGQLWADEIELDHAPRIVETAVSKEIDSEILLIDPDGPMVHQLTPAGSLLVSFFDGQTTLAELSEDLALATDMKLEDAQDQLLEMAETLADSGLLEDVFPIEIDLPDPPKGIEVGEELRPFALPNAEGTTVDLTELRGRQVLLVNWSPRCGYCDGIADELGTLQPKMQEQGVDLVFVATGEAEENVELFDDHGLSAPVLLTDDAGDDFEAIHPFPGMGTPCAYLLDADGRVAAPFAYGANEVPTLARQVAGIVELPIVKEASASDEDEDEEDLELPEIPGVKYLTSQADEVCGPGASGAKKPRIWAGTRAYAIGEYHIGVRADSPETHETLRAVFAAYRLPDDTPAPTNFSIVLGDHEGSSRGLHLLLEGNGVVVRTRSSSRVLYGLAAYLSNVIAPATSGATLRTYDRLGVVDGKAVILPGLILNDLEHVQAGLAKLGVAVADEPVTTIDLEGTEAVVPEPLVTPDAGAIEQLPEPKRWTTELPRVLPGRYPLAGWFTWTGDPEARDVSRAEAVAKAMHAAMLDPDNLVEQVDRLSDLFERVKPTGLSFEDPKGFLASLEAGLTR